jgi:hypothetical protein
MLVQVMPTTGLLRDTLSRAARLLGSIRPPVALGATLASRLHGIPGLQAISPVGGDATLLSSHTGRSITTGGPHNGQ